MLKKHLIPISICLLFFIAYTLLAIIKHQYFLSGYDLAVVDQVVWKYSQLKAPLTTIHAYAFTLLFTDHIEIIYLLLAPFYWIANNVITLIILQTALIAVSGIPVYLLARQQKLPRFLSAAVLISYLSFYGIQNALWSDVHSLVFAAAFLPWLLYFLYQGNKWGTGSMLILVLLCKEDSGLLTAAISIVYFLVYKKKLALTTLILSIIYIGSIFFVYYPNFTNDGYRHAAKGGILSDLNISYLYDSTEKQQVYFYSFAWFGFLPLIALGYLIPAMTDLIHYFVLGHAQVSAAGGLFLHYRVTLAILLVWPTIIALSKLLTSKYKKYFNPNILAIYLLVCAFAFQYLLHAPLSYLSKKWFWTRPQSVDSINAILKDLPPTAAVVSQNNITPHIAHRDNIFTLWPTTRTFKNDYPCGKPACKWFRWSGNPTYMIVDTSNDWDARHFLTSREEFISGLDNLEKRGVIKKYKQKNNTILYKIIK